MLFQDPPFRIPLWGTVSLAFGAAESLGMALETENRISETMRWPKREAGTRAEQARRRNGKPESGRNVGSQ